MTGDDGEGNSTTGLSVHNTVKGNTFIDNGDGMEFTRGTSDSMATDNVFLVDSHPPAGFLPSQAIEFAGSGDNDNTIVGNTLRGGMSDGFQLSGTGNLVQNNTISGEANAIDANGSDSTVRDNVITGNHQGISGRGTGYTIMQNSIYDNGKPISLCNAGGSCSTSSTYGQATLGIDFGPTGPTANDAGDVDAVQNFPVLTRVTRAGLSLKVAGTLSSKSNSSYRIEIFASQKAGSSGYGEGQSYLGRVTVSTNANGAASFAVTLPLLYSLLTSHQRPYLSATATDLTTHSTSEFSLDLNAISSVH